MTLGRGMGWLMRSKHFPQSILQVGPQKPRDGPGHTATLKTSPLQCKKATGKWDQAELYGETSPISLVLQGKGSATGAPSCPCPLCLISTVGQVRDPLHLGAVKTRLQSQV